MRLKGKRESVILAAMIGVFLIIMAVCFRPVFYLNDDVTIRSILSGSYTGVPDGHAVYMKYPLTGLLSALYRLTDVLPWLEIFYSGCILWVLMAWISSCENKWFGWILGGLFVLPFYFYMHYTVIAALLAGTAVFLIGNRNRFEEPVCLWLLAWMVRSQVAYLSLPFLLVAILWRLSEKERGNLFEATWKAVCIGVVGWLCCAGVHHICYSGEDWRAYLGYNESRTELYDYTNFLSTDYYEDNYEQYGMSAEEFALLGSYNTILDATIDDMKMEQVADDVKDGMEAEKDQKVWLKECIRRYYYHIRYPNNIYTVLWLGAVFALAALTLFSKKWLAFGILSCLEVGRSLIWIFLIWRDRFPERVEVSLYIIEGLLLAGIFGHICPNILVRMEEKGQYRRGSVAKVGICMVLAVLLALQVKMDGERVFAQKEVQKEWTTLKEYCGNNCDKLYLLDVFSAVEYGGLYGEKDAGNIMLAGGWMSASPLVAERLSSYGTSDGENEYLDGATALYESEKVVFLVEKERDVQWLVEYLENRFGPCILQAENEIICSEDKVFVEYRVVLC